MSFLVLGDLCLGEAPHADDVRGNSDLLAGVRSLLKDKTLVIANLECAITQSQEGLPFKWATLKAPPTAISQVKGLDVAILANNHIGDFGNSGVAETISLLEAAGKKHVGYGHNLEEALKPVVLETDEGSVAIVALVCPTTNSECLASYDRPGVAPLSSMLLQRAIEAARKQADSVLVYLHWGVEQSHDPVPEQMRLARRAIDWGASVVIGCHAHVIQGHEAYRDGWIFYGLGNFYFPTVETREVLADGNMRHACQVQARPNRQSLAVELTLSPSKKGGKTLIPTAITLIEFEAGYGPSPIEKAELTVALDRLNARLRRYAKLYWRRLQKTDEPEYRAVIRNGIPAYFYPELPISERDLSLVRTLRCKVSDFVMCLKGYLKQLLVISPRYSRR